MSASGAGGGADDLDIRGGGVVAVDTASLRGAVGRLLASAEACDDIAASLARCRAGLEGAGIWLYPPVDAALDAAAHARRLAGDLQMMADLYEVVELQARIAIAGRAGNEAFGAHLRAQVDDRLVADPTLLRRLTAEDTRWLTENLGALRTQYGIGLDHTMYDSAPLIAALVLGIRAVGLGTVSRATPLSGPRDPVRIERLERTATTAPASIAQLTDRIPAGDARVRVERYTMPGGARQYVAYVAGTAGGGGDEAWDWDANLQLYARSDAASHDAVRAALADAGARPGDTVTLSGYSQGAMIASHVALSEVYDVPMLVTFGDPVQADVGPQTLSVALRHTDDPVSALAGGGFAGVVGAEGSFVASREVPGVLARGDGMIEPHGIDRYRETAQMLDASTDPRMGAVRARLAALAEATSVEAFVYTAERTELRAGPRVEVPPVPPPEVTGGAGGGG